jgi:alpha/beta superfamily hydrolase
MARDVDRSTGLAATSGSPRDLASRSHPRRSRPMARPRYSHEPRRKARLAVAISALAVVFLVAVGAAGLIGSAHRSGGDAGALQSATAGPTSRTFARFPPTAGQTTAPGGPAATTAPSAVAPPVASGSGYAPTPGSRADQSAGYKVVGSVPYTSAVDCGATRCEMNLDIYVPSGDGPFPAVVLIGPNGRSYLAAFAADLANLGILVYNANFRDVASQGGGYPAGFQDVACAVRYARTNASQHGGLAGPITLVGHSLGGWVGSVVALDHEEFVGGCLAAGSGRPDAFVGLAGNYQIDSGENSTDLNDFFGGSATAMAAAYAASNPFNYAAGASIPVRLVAGTEDETVDPYQSIALDSFLVKRAWDVTLTMIAGGTHMSILREPLTRAAVSSAIAAACSNQGIFDPVRPPGG